MQFEPHGFDGLYGLEVIDVSEGVLRGRVAVREEIKQPAGLVHGGVYASIADSLASLGTGLAVTPKGRRALGRTHQTSFLRPITDATINAVASVRHRGRTTWVWEVENSDDQGRLCVLIRTTMADEPSGRVNRRSGS